MALWLDYLLFREDLGLLEAEVDEILDDLYGVVDKCLLLFSIVPGFRPGFFCSVPAIFKVGQYFGLWDL